MTVSKEEQDFRNASKVFYIVCYELISSIKTNNHQKREKIEFALQNLEKIIAELTLEG